MSEKHLEIKGSFKSTSDGNVDWYYGGGKLAWDDPTSAKAGVPSVVRSGKTVGIKINNKIVEYIWHPEDITDNGLVLKTASSNFDTSLDSNITMKEQYLGFLQGLSVFDLKGKSITEILELSLFPETNAKIINDPNFIIEGFTGDGGIYEVGTGYSPILEIEWDAGTILDGDGLSTGSVSGALDTISIYINGGQQYNNPLVTASYDLVNVPNHILVEGGNAWAIEGTNLAGTMVYETDRGNNIPVAEIDNAIANTTVTPVVYVKTGRFKHFIYSGVDGSHPTNSTNIRLLDNGFLDANKEAEFEYTVSAGEDEIVVYTYENKTIEIINDNTGEVITTTNVVSINVDDANGDPRPYEKHVFSLGGVGFTVNTLLKIRIL